MRMKFIRILPDTRASTRCPLLSSTRKNAFGSGSTTTPSTSIASSFGDSVVTLRASFFLADRLRAPLRLRAANPSSFRHIVVGYRQDLESAGRHGHRVLEMSG